MALVIVVVVVMVVVGGGRGGSSQQKAGNELSELGGVEHPTYICTPCLPVGYCMDRPAPSTIGRIGFSGLMRSCVVKACSCAAMKTKVVAWFW